MRQAKRSALDPLKPSAIHTFARLAPAFPKDSPRAYALRMDAELERLFEDMRALLLARREHIAREIARHPRPITACDVHFNRLLEERALLSEELDRLDAFVAASPLLRRASVVS